MSKILFLGDFVYDEKIINEDIINIAEFIKKNEYTVVLNLEAPLKSNNPLSKWLNLYNEEIFIKIIKLLNVKAVNLANNHIMDWSEDGLKKLLNILKKNKIGYFGAGLNLKESKAPFMLEIEEKKVCLLGYGWDIEMCVYATENTAGVAPLNEEDILNDIEKYRKISDIVISNMHWGYEYEVYPIPVQRKLAQKMIEKGAEVIIGHHPHIIQAKENYLNKSIYYSLGNFYFGSRRCKFELLKNKIAKKYSNFGLGILFDVNTKKTFEIYFEYKNNKTSFIKEYPVVDITKIELTHYNKFFKENKTSNHKPSLYIYKNKKIQNIIMRLKLKLFEYKNNIKVKIVKIIKQ